MIKMWADIVLAPSWCSHLIPTPLCETYSCLRGGEAHRFLILWGETKALIHSTVTQEGGFCTYQSKNVVWPRDPIIKLKRQEKAPFTLGPFIHSRARLCISLHMNKVSGLFYREMHQARGFNDKIMSRRGRYFFLQRVCVTENKAISPFVSEERLGSAVRSSFGKWLHTCTGQISI